MGAAPSTVVQVVLAVLFVLPGMTYQFLRERWRGPVPGEHDLPERVLRAVVASICLDAVYALVAGPQLVRMAGSGAAERQPRLVGLIALLLFVVVPAAGAATVSWCQRRRLRAAYASTPTAWDHVFRDRGPCFVRARLKDGGWVGGWFGTRSYASSYPQTTELFLQSAWRMNPDGSFADRVAGSAGVYLRAQDVDLVEFLEPPAEEDGA